MNDALKITLPVIIGMCISTPIMLAIDLTQQDQTSMFWVTLPMMIGAGISAVLAFWSGAKSLKEVREEKNE